MTNLLPNSSNPFDRICRINELGRDFWPSRDLAQVLGYTTSYANFTQVIDKAKVACANSGHDVQEHFDDYDEMIEIGKGAKRKIKSVGLSRYAC